MELIVDAIFMPGVQGGSTRARLSRIASTSVAVGIVGAAAIFSWSKINEALTKVLCHNLCVVIQSMYELNVTPEFWSEAA